MLRIPAEAIRRPRGLEGEGNEVMLWYVMLRYVTLRVVTLRYVMWCEAILCYVMLCHVLWLRIPIVGA